MVFNLDMARLLDNLQMTFINRSVVISRAVTILRSNETYLCIEGLRKAFAGSKGSRRDQGVTGFMETKHCFRVGSAHCPGRLRCDVSGEPLFTKVPCGGGSSRRQLTYCGFLGGGASELSCGRRCIGVCIEDL